MDAYETPEMAAAYHRAIQEEQCLELECIAAYEAELRAENEHLSTLEYIPF